MRKRSSARRELKKKAVDYKGGSCENCGYNRCLAALTFHHKDPTQKDFGISSKMDNIAWKRIKAELNKCALLCSNCHTEVHDGYVNF